MLYSTYTVGGELYHAGNYKYIDKVKMKSGKWRYIYRSKHGAGWRRPNRVWYGDKVNYGPSKTGFQYAWYERPLENKGYSKADINNKKRQIHEEVRNDIDKDHVVNDRTVFEYRAHNLIEDAKKKLKRTLIKLSNKIITKP